MVINRIVVYLAIIVLEVGVNNQNSINVEYNLYLSNVTIKKTNTPLLSVFVPPKVKNFPQGTSSYFNIYIIRTYRDKWLVYFPNFVGCEGSGCYYRQVIGDVGIFYPKTMKFKTILGKVWLWDITATGVIEKIPNLEFLYNHFMKYLQECFIKFSDEFRQNLERCRQTKCYKNYKGILSKIVYNMGTNLIDYWGSEYLNLYKVYKCYIGKFNKDPRRRFPLFPFYKNYEDTVNKIIADNHLSSIVFPIEVEKGYLKGYRPDFVSMWLFYNIKDKKLRMLKLPKNFEPYLLFYLKGRLTLMLYKVKRQGGLNKIIICLLNMMSQKVILYRLFYFKEEVKEIFPSPDGKFLSVVTNINCAPQDKIKDHDGEIALNIDCIKDVKEPKKFFTTKKVNTLVFCSQESSGTERKQIQTLWLIKLDTKRRISITDNIYTKHSHIIDYKYKKLEKEGEYGYRYINKCKRYFDNLAWIAGNTFLPSDIEKVIWNSNSKEFLFSIRPVFEKDTLLWFYFKEEDNIDRYFRGKGRLDKLYFPEDIYKVYLGIVEKDSSVKVSVEGFYRDNLIYRVYTDVCTVAGKYEPAVVMGTGKSVGSIIDGLCNACRRGWSCYKEDRRMPISSWLLFVPKGLALQKSSMK